MTIRALSASQAERFDPEQVGGCKRRWYFQNVMGLEVPESEASKEDGHAGHALFAMHYRGETLPKRHRMLKAVRGALTTGQLPTHEPGQLVESRFDGQAARDGNGERVHLDTARTLWLGGVPWDGYVDLRFYRAGMITVLDFKFSSDIHAYAKPAESLINTVQMPVYALDSLRLWPEAQHVELVHYYVSRKGVDSFKRRQLVSVEQVRQRGREIERIVADMQAVSEAKSPDDVPGNRKSCNTWSGCPFQSRCSAFKERPKMDLNPEESEWLNALDGGKAEKPAPEAEVGDARDAVNVELKKAATEFVKAPSTGPEADAVTELEIASAAGALSADDDPFAVFAPKPSVPQEQPAKPPSCPDCGTELNMENGSRRDGKWSHVGCPAKSAAPAAAGPKCPACPHPAHGGTACTGKRGRGACRCGAQGALEKSQDAAALAGGHLPTCVQNDAGKWLCMEGCSVGSAVNGSVAPPSLTVSCDKCGTKSVFRGEGEERWKAARAEGWHLPGRGLPGSVFCNAHAPAASYAESGTAADQERARIEAEMECAPGCPVALDGSGSHLIRCFHKSSEERLASLSPVLAEKIITPPPTGWTGTLQVNVNLGSETLALLTRIFGR